MLKIIRGDLIQLAKEGKFGYIIHGCNCFITMGAGIAKSIATNFPWAKLVDRSYGRKGDIRKLGNYTIAKIKISQQIDFFVVNMYTQYTPGPSFEIMALELGLRKFFQGSYDLKTMPEVGVPLIGCGLGGGKELEVKTVLEKYAKTYPITLVLFDNEKPLETQIE